jgi:hypothetical protein
MPSSSDSEAAARAAALRKRLAAKKMTIADFGRRAGFTRNITYGVMKGRKLKPAEAARVDDLLGPET